MQAQLEISEITSLGGFTDFTGDSLRTPKKYTVSCLYRRSFTEFQRQKFGIEEDVSAIIYVPPANLIKVLGTFKIQDTRTNVYLHDTLMAVKKVVYLEPIYNGEPIVVELRLKTLSNGAE